MKSNDIISKLVLMKQLHLESRRKLKEIAKHQDAIRKLEIEIYDIEHSFNEVFSSTFNDLRGAKDDNTQT